MRCRNATRADLPAIVRLLADDPLGSGRERPAEPVPEAYGVALGEIQARPGNTVILAED